MAEIAITKMPSHLKRIHKEEYSKSSLSSKDKKKFIRGRERTNTGHTTASGVDSPSQHQVGLGMVAERTKRVLTPTLKRGLKDIHTVHDAGKRGEREGVDRKDTGEKKKRRGRGGKIEIGLDNCYAKQTEHET
jgi:hypothetical protein